MTPEALAALHRRAFAGPPRPWSPDEFAELLGDPSVRVLTAGGEAFAVIRLAGPEGEVLTICTDPGARRRGLGLRLLSEAEMAARAAGAEEMFLEVAETNAPARALYARAGYAERGYRKNYYSASGRTAVSALVLGKRLT